MFLTKVNLSFIGCGSESTFSASKISEDRISLRRFRSGKEGGCPHIPEMRSGSARLIFDISGLPAISKWKCGWVLGECHIDPREDDRGSSHSRQQEYIPERCRSSLLTIMFSISTKQANGSHIKGFSRSRQSGDRLVRISVICGRM